MDDNEFVILEEEIEERVLELAKEINNYYNNKGINSINVIFILTGAFIFTSDLIRELNILGLKMKTRDITVHSYYGTESGQIELIEKDFRELNLNNSDVLIIDDILDTGKTLSAVRKKILEMYDINSLEVCVFLKKRIEGREVNFNINFIGFTIPNLFVVGYGLDYNGEYRELPYIIDLGQLREE